jgi:methylmalonyl-CoA mutase cobalamin-binding domain/chain
VTALLPRDLPDGRELIAEGRAQADRIICGRSLLCEEFGTRSEPDYKRLMVERGRLMQSMNMGLPTWAAQADGLERVHAATESHGFRVDRYVMQLDRRMGVPPESRALAAKETGPMLQTDAEWMATARTVPIQPVLGDMMIGSPMSVDNATRALQAGVSYVGNMSQLHWKYPNWSGTDADQMIEAVKALGIMAGKAHDGATVSSYLDDGFSALYNDYCSMIGWAMFEHYLVDEVIGARLGVSYGGLTRDPAIKAAVILALESITPESSCNGFWHGNTTAYTRDVERNYGVLGTDVLFMYLAVIRSRSAAAVHAVPVTEALRVPTWQEIVEAQTISNRIGEDATQLVDTIDWARIEAVRDRLLDGGRRFLENVLTGLEELGVDLGDPLQLILSVRRLGAVEIERRFGIGSPPELGGESEPVIPTDTLKDFIADRLAIRGYFAARRPEVPPDSRTVVASTDIHEYGIRLLAAGLREVGIEPVMAGLSLDPEELADVVLEADATAVLVSTHNGMALTYARRLVDALASRRLNPTVVFGGTLNEDTETDADAPVDVTDELRALGIKVCEQVTEVLDALGLNDHASVAGGVGR